MLGTVRTKKLNSRKMLDGNGIEKASLLNMLGGAGTNKLSLLKMREGDGMKSPFKSIC